MTKKRKHLAVRKNGAVIIMSGISGSGKSTVSEQLRSEIGPEQSRIISSDKIRNKLLPKDADHETDLKNSRKKNWTKKRIDDLMVEELKLGLNHNKVNIVDATNLSNKEQDKFAKIGKKYNVPVISVKLTTRIEDAKKRNNLRGRKVPDNVIDSMEKKRITKGDQRSPYIDEVIEIDNSKKVKKADIKKVVNEVNTLDLKDQEVSHKQVSHKLNSQEDIDFDVAFNDKNFVAYAEDIDGNTKTVAGNVPDDIENVEVEEVDGKLIVEITEEDFRAHEGDKYTFFVDETSYD